jgi:hypothetical protein
MFHIAYSRLMLLCKEAVIRDRSEAAHLRYCEECRLLLRSLAEHRIRSLERQREMARRPLPGLDKTA